MAKENIKRKSLQDFKSQTLEQTSPKAKVDLVWPPMSLTPGCSSKKGIEICKRKLQKNKRQTTTKMDQLDGKTAQ